MAVQKPIFQLIVEDVDRQVAISLTDTAGPDLLRVDSSKLAAHFPALQHA